MPHPTDTPATLRPDLASLVEFDLAGDRKNCIAHRVLPVLDVASQSGTFGIIPLEELLQHKDTIRAVAGTYARGNWKWKTGSYATEEHGWEEPVDDRERRMYRNYFKAEVFATARAVDFVLRNAEMRAADLLFNETTWNGSGLTTAVGTEWSNKAAATPVDDVLAARRKTYEACGLWPNALIINRYVFQNLRRCAQVIDSVTASGAGSAAKPRDITTALLAEVLDVDDVIVAGGAQNTAQEGATPAIAQLWSSEYAMVATVAQTDDVQEPCVGRTFHWGGDGSDVDAIVESYREEKVRSEIIRARHEVQEKVLHVESAHLLSNITA